MSQDLRRPLILLLDDKTDARESMRELFEALECSVIPVASYESALAEISARPDINFVVTDLNLKPETNDKSGIIFAKMVRQLREDIPVAAYSAKTKDMAISANEYRIFDFFLDKRSDNPEEARRFANDCKALALAHKQMSMNVLDQLGSPKGNNTTSLQAMESKLHQMEAKVSAIESSYIRMPNIAPYARTVYVIIGLLGAIASIWGLYVVAR